MNQYKYADMPKPPVYLHMLGQDLVDAMWIEMQVMKREIEWLENKIKEHEASDHEHTTNS